MRDLIGAITNKMLNEIVDETVREALKLQVKANKEYAKQKSLEESGEPYNYKLKHTLEEGVRGLCEVLWTTFGGCTADSMAVIREIADQNDSDHLGYDCQDYVSLFMEAFAERRGQSDY